MRRTRGYTQIGCCVLTSGVDYRQLRLTLFATYAEEVLVATDEDVTFAYRR